MARRLFPRCGRPALGLLLVAVVVILVGSLARGVSPAPGSGAGPLAARRAVPEADHAALRSRVNPVGLRSIAKAPVVVLTAATTLALALLVLAAGVTAGPRPRRVPVVVATGRGPPRRG